MLHRTVLGILAILVISATSGWAQDEGLLSQWYGTGVHAYFSGDTTRALQDLTQAADGAPRTRGSIISGHSLTRGWGTAMLPRSTWRPVQRWNPRTAMAVTR